MFVDLVGVLYHFSRLLMRGFVFGKVFMAIFLSLTLILFCLSLEEPLWVYCSFFYSVTSIYLTFAYSLISPLWTFITTLEDLFIAVYFNFFWFCAHCFVAFFAILFGLMNMFLFIKACVDFFEWFISIIKTKIRVVSYVITIYLLGATKE